VAHRVSRGQAMVDPVGLAALQAFRNPTARRRLVGGAASWDRPMKVSLQTEGFAADEARRLYDALSCPKDYMLFTLDEAAEAHCQVAAFSVLYQRLFDWLEDFHAKRLSEDSRHPAGQAADSV
jgi:hypothetical protein